MDAAVALGLDMFGNMVTNMTNYSMNQATNKANKQLAYDNYQYNKALMENAQQYNTDMWNMNNEYNSPAAQMQRLAEAGINPNVAFMNGQTNNTTSGAPSSPSGSVSQAPAMQSARFNNPFGGVLNYALQKRELDLKDKELNIRDKEADSNIGLNRANQHNIEQQTDQQAWKFTQDLENLKAKGRLDNAAAAKLEAEIDNVRASLDLINKQIESVDANTRQTLWVTHKDQMLYQLEKAKLSNEVAKIAKEVLYLETQTRESESRIEVNGQQVLLTRSQTGAIEWKLGFDQEHAETSLYIERGCAIGNTICNGINAAANIIKAVHPLKAK